MSVIEYSDLLFEISRRLDELNVLDRLLFMCRRNLAPGSADNIQNALSLFEKLEEQNDLGADRLEVIKRLLKSLKEWSLFGKVGQFESKRKKYNDLLEHIIHALDELDDLERLIAICKGKISEESEFQIQDVRSLIKELENQNNLYDRLDILKGILTEMEKSYLVKEVEEFEERRNQEDELERKKGIYFSFFSYRNSRWSELLARSISIQSFRSQLMKVAEVVCCHIYSKVSKQSLYKFVEKKLIYVQCKGKTNLSEDHIPFESFSNS